MSSQVCAPRRVSFAVADVTPAKERLPEITAREALERTAGCRLLGCPGGNSRVAEGGDFHPLIAAAALAFKQHYPLVLSPDAIWLTVLQGVAQHINNNAAGLRSRLVHHQTKIELIVPTDLSGLPENNTDMLGLADAFVERIAQHVKREKRFLLDTRFTTTSDLDRITACIVLMDGFQPYFDYAILRYFD